MMTFRLMVSTVAALGALAGSAGAQGECSFTTTTSGPTYNKNAVFRPHARAGVLAHEGVYAGLGDSEAEGLLGAGGSAVAVAAEVYWFRVQHNPIEGECPPVHFESTATLRAEGHAEILGDSDDYALVAGHQAASGIVLPPLAVAMAATVAGTTVAPTTLTFSWAGATVSITIPGVSVTTNTFDRDRKAAAGAGIKTTKVERIDIHSWVRIKVVTDGPFGGTAEAKVDRTSATASTLALCPVHQVIGQHTHNASDP